MQWYQIQEFLFNDRSDENLVVACQAGDRSAYELIVKRHYKHVFLVCLGIFTDFI